MSRFTVIDGVAKLRADQVQIGDLLDFEGDKFADPNGNGLSDSGHFEPFEFELAYVTGVTRETDDCIRIDTDQGSYGFPVDHLIPAEVRENVKAQFYYCGGCGHWHPPEFMGDCRDDANRFTTSELEDRYGSDGFEPVNPEDAAADGVW
jgi:hypothetical protein